MSKENTTATEAVTTNTVLNGKDCRKIICLTNGNPYKSGKRKDAGKTYSQYRLGTIVFNVPDDSPFVADQKAGNLDTVEFINGTIDKVTIDEDGNEVTKQVPSLEFDYHFTKSQELTDAKHDYQMKLFSNLASQPVTDDFLAALMNA